MCPLAWVRPYGLGRVCYCALGHGSEQLEHESVQRILRNALEWLAGVPARPIQPGI